jgi:hypothetical protein
MTLELARCVKRGRISNFSSGGEKIRRRRRIRLQHGPVSGPPRDQMRGLRPAAMKATKARAERDAQRQPSRILARDLPRTFRLDMCET